MIPNDHDLLIRIDAKVELLTASVTAFELSSQQDRVKLWAEKASSLEVTALATDHEKRLRFVERSAWIGIGALAILQIVLKFGWPH